MITMMMMIVNEKYMSLMKNNENNHEYEKNIAINVF
jgi:hypothetical protein